MSPPGKRKSSPPVPIAAPEIEHQWRCPECCAVTFTRSAMTVPVICSMCSVSGRGRVEMRGEPVSSGK